MHDQSKDKLRAKLREIESELSEVRGEHAEAVKDLDKLSEQFANSGDLSTDSEAFKAAEAATERVGELADRIAELQQMQVATLRMLGEDTPAAARDGDRPVTRGWDSSHLLQDEKVQQQLRFHSSGTRTRLETLHLGQVADAKAVAAMFGADVTGTANMRRGDYYGVASQPRVPLRVLDLMPIGTMEGNSLPYTRETGSFDTAAETPEGELKPEAEVGFEDAEAVAKTIAHWTKIAKQSLADFPALQSIIDARLRYGVNRRLERQTLVGDGQDANLQGILATSGVGVVDYAAEELIADQVLRGLTTVILAGGEPNGIVMHPADWQATLLAKAQGDGHYYSGGPFSVTPQVLWGVPLIPSPAIPQGEALVGDFAIGAQLFIREGINVLLSDSDGDDFLRNRVTILAELRAALAVFRPAVFCRVSLAESGGA